MTIRERKTWENKTATRRDVLPVEEAAAKRASAHPQTPDEGLTHPAAYADPEADAYMNGDPESWAEGVHPGPYRTSPAPANPMDDGGYRHPAAQPGAPAKNASMTRQAAEIQAAKCIRIAQALLGKEASESLIEDQALDFMDLPDFRLTATLRRLEASTEDEEVLLRKMLAAEDESEGVEEKEEAEEEAEPKTAATDHMAQVLSLIAGLTEQIAALKTAPVTAAAPVVACGEDTMVAGGADMDEDEAMLASMLAAEVEGPGPIAQDFDDTGISMDPVDDPMSFDDFAPEDEDLMSLYASDLDGMKSASKLAGDEEEEVEEEEEEPADKTAAGRTAAQRVASTQLRPQPKKPSVGAKTLGTVRTASGEAGDLARLWDSAPDVSSVFGK